jgi:hypothetical protein
MLIIKKFLHTNSKSLIFYGTFSFSETEYKELFPALRTRYFFGFRGRGGAAPPGSQKIRAVNWLGEGEKGRGHLKVITIL